MKRACEAESVCLCVVGECVICASLMETGSVAPTGGGQN